VAVTEIVMVPATRATALLLLLPPPTRWPRVAMALATKAIALLLLPLPTRCPRVAANMALALRTGTMVVMTAVYNVSSFPRLL
jgi:hypothetical protein